MTVYVDNMKASLGRMIMCHMIADSDDELHRMADTIGIDRKHWQSPEKTSGSHYDICKQKRAMAVKAGAVEISLRVLAVMNKHRRQHGRLGSPREALLAYGYEYLLDELPKDPAQADLFG